MPDLMLNQDATVAAYFENESGAITGATVTVDVIDRISGTTIIDDASAIEGAVAGTYEYEISKTNLTTARRLQIVFTGTLGTIDLYHELFATVGVVRPGTLTLHQVRMRIAEMLGGDDEVWELEATGGSTTTAVVPGLVIGGTGEYRGGWLSFRSGNNRTLERRVTAFDDATTTLTFAPAVTANVANGDMLDLLPIRPSSINRAIDDALVNLGHGGLSETQEQLCTTDGTTEEWALPSDCRFVTAVGLYRISDSQFLGWLAPDEWSVEPAGTLRVTGEYIIESPLNWLTSHALPSGYRLRVKMLVAPTLPLYDHSYVDASASYLVPMASSYLMTRGHVREETDLQRANFLAQRAELERRRMLRGIPPGAIEVLP